MKYTKEEIEKRLNYTLHEALRDIGQEDSIQSLKYNEKTGACTIKMDVHIVEEDDYVGFGVY